jgi:hypothetical protein
MSKKSPTSVSVPKFFGRYWNRLSKAEDRERLVAGPCSIGVLMTLLGDGEGIDIPRLITTGKLWDEVRIWWPVRMLQQAAADRDVEGFKRLLHYFLNRMGVQPPAGVLTPFRWEPGRPEETEDIYEAWIAMGRPSPDWHVLDELAKTFYPRQFEAAKSDVKLRKNLRDRIRATILRHEARDPATKTLSVA